MHVKLPGGRLEKEWRKTGGRVDRDWRKSGQRLEKERRETGERSVLEGAHIARIIMIQIPGPGRSVFVRTYFART